MQQIIGVAAGVPYVALPPNGKPDGAPLVVAWHLHDPPRSETAMAAALPLNDSRRLFRCFTAVLSYGVTQVPRPSGVGRARRCRAGPVPVRRCFRPGRRRFWGADRTPAPVA